MVNSKLVLGGRSRTTEKEFKNLLIGHSKEKNYPWYVSIWKLNVFFSIALGSLKNGNLIE